LWQINGRLNIVMLFKCQYLSYRRPAETVDQVVDGQDRVVKEHTGARIAHDCADFFPQVLFIAVDGAFYTRRFFEFVRAAINALVGIFCQRLAIRTEMTRWGIVMRAAIEGNHLADGFLFSF